MTATAIKLKKSKPSAFQTEARSNRNQTVLPSSSQIASLKEQERLSDWDHAS